MPTVNAFIVSPNDLDAANWNDVRVLPYTAPTKAARQALATTERNRLNGTLLDATTLTYTPVKAVPTGAVWNGRTLADSRTLIDHLLSIGNPVDRTLATEIQTAIDTFLNAGG